MLVALGSSPRYARRDGNLQVTAVFNVPTTPAPAELIVPQTLAIMFVVQHVSVLPPRGIGVESIFHRAFGMYGVGYVLIEGPRRNTPHFHPAILVTSPGPVGELL